MDWNKGLKSSVPYLVLLFGLLAFLYGTFGTFQSSEWKDFWSGLGKTMVASGVFALLLKTIQFMGVFKEELTKIIFEPRYLNNRNDLPTYWEKVTTELVKNKFPSISKKLMRDITESYLPTKHSIYYDDFDLFINLKSFNKGIAEFENSLSLNIICNDGKEKCEYRFNHFMPYKEDEGEVFFELDYLKVDDAAEKPKKTVSKENKVVINSFLLELTGKDRYKIERKEIKRYNLIDDNIYNYTANKIIHNFKVAIQHPTNISVELKKCGTICDFSLKKVTNQFKEYKYEGIVYPQQGFIVFFKINK